MINVQEHVYHDDPKVGPHDVRTELRGVDYFFLGNGLIQAAVQIAPAGDGTPVGLLIMNPDRLRKKREALTMDRRRGLSPTMVRLRRGAERYEPRSAAVHGRWLAAPRIPTVAVSWNAAELKVEEFFSCPRWNDPVLYRAVRLKSTARTPMTVEVETGVKRTNVRTRVTLKPGETKTLTVEYILDRASDAVRLSFVRSLAADAAATSFWSGLGRVSFSHPLLDHYFRASKFQLPVAVARSGCADGGIWQYNREWLRDQAMLALALTMVGALAPAATMFGRLLDRFVTPEGDTVDSSEQRHPDEVELDQNGFLLYTLKDYALWTGQLEIVREKWGKVVAAAEFPLRATFRHGPSGLLANRREFWERHRAHGIEPGIELVHQLYTAHGLAAAAVLARLTGHEREAARWDEESSRIKTAMLEDPCFRMADSRGFIKRRGLDGRVQETIAAGRDSGLPDEAPLVRPGEHFLNPDTSAALPIALGMVPPNSPFCRPTLAALETLWNQEWTGGGYGRYHASSEPDSPGAWPFPSLFVARASVEMGDDDNVWRILKWLATVPGAGAGTWFEFYGKRLAPPFPQVGIVPWSWAEMIVLFVHHILGVQPQENGLRIRPRLLSGLDRVKAIFPFRGKRLRLEIARTPERRRAGFRTNGTVLREDPGEIVIAYGKSPLAITAAVASLKHGAVRTEAP